MERAAICVKRVKLMPVVTITQATPMVAAIEMRLD
jgi:hypothetical protein